MTSATGSLSIAEGTVNIAADIAIDSFFYKEVLDFWLEEKGFMQKVSEQSDIFCVEPFFIITFFFTKKVVDYRAERKECYENDNPLYERLQKRKYFSAAF